MGNALFLIVPALLFGFVAWIVSRDRPRDARRRDVKKANARAARAQATISQLEQLINENRAALADDIVARELLNSLTTTITEFRVEELKKELDQ